MIHPTELTETDARHAIETGEFSDTIIRSRRNVVIVLTQGWCPQWAVMNRWLEKLINGKEPVDLEIDLYSLVYDRVPYFYEFLAFKEVTFRNYSVPYLRYYVDGQLIGESNYCSRRQFFARFES